MIRSLLPFLVLALLMGCGADPADSGTLRVENLRLVRDRSGVQTVSGVLHNTSNESRNAQVEITLYGPRNERLGAVHVPVENVEAGSIKGFEWSLDMNVEGVRVRRIMVF